MKGKLKQTTVRLPEALHLRMKIMAAKQGITLGDMIAQIMAEHIKGKK